jgi:subtilisin
MRALGLVALAAVVAGAAQAGPGQNNGRSADATEGRFLDVIVVLDEGFAPGGHAANRAEAARTARGLGVSPRFSYGTALFGFAGRVPEGRLNGLRNDPRVAYVDFDAPVSIPRPRTAAPKWCTPESTHPACNKDEEPDPGTEPAPADDIPWGVDRIDAGLNGNMGTDIHVYILDTGIDSNHPDLRVNIGNGLAVELCKGKTSTCHELWDDDHGHGTHVSGTVGAAQNGKDVIGVAPEVTLHAVKVLAKNGSGWRSGVIAGIDWVASQVSGAPVVANMSLGGSGSKTGVCTGSGFTGSDSYHQAICNAKNAGVVFAVAAGNSGADAENQVPAAYYDAVMTASATNSSDNWPSWSNWGDGFAAWTTNASAPVAIAAPGVSILSTRMGGGTTKKSGTSMASPHVAGAIALYLKSNPQSPDDTAFANARGALLGVAEETNPTFPNTSGHPHAEDFLYAGGL